MSEIYPVPYTTEEVPPSPEGSAITESSGPTELYVGAVADGEYLRRSGTTIIGDAGSGGGPVKASGAELDTGTDDAKYATAKALADSAYAKTTDITATAVGLDNVDNTSDADKPVSSATQTALDLKAPLTPAVNPQTGTTYTLQASDNGKVVTLSNAAGITVTVPSGLGAGFNCLCVQIGAGQVTFSPSSTTVNNRQSHTKIAGQYGQVSLVAYAANVFALGGDTAA